MPQAFLRLEISNPGDKTVPASQPDIEPGREEVRILVIGSAHGVERVVQELFAKRFAEVREWSDPIPTGRFREIMRILTRFILVK
jgi:hypothetical protein